MNMTLFIILKKILSTSRVRLQGFLFFFFCERLECSRTIGAHCSLDLSAQGVLPPLPPGTTGSCHHVQLSCYLFSYYFLTFYFRFRSTCAGLSGKLHVTGVWYTDYFVTQEISIVPNT